MKKQPDKLFRNKLHDYQRPVSREAWARVAQNLDKKHRSFAWMKIAATVLIVAAAGLWLFRPQEPGRQLTHRDVPRQDTIEGQTSAPTADQQQKSQSLDQVTPDGEQPAADQPPLLKNDQHATQQRVAQENRLAPLDELAPEKVAEVPQVAVVTDEQKPEQQSTPSASSADNSRHRVTIVFTAEEVDDKYLAKSPVPEATPDKENASTLEKLLDKARDLKHNQDLIGDLRQRKNEIFAFNLRGDKPREN